MTVSVPEFLKLREVMPAVDVRSEGEFSEGHIPGVVNIPILNDAERKAVGTDYKQKGQREAIKTGFRLVGPRILDIVNHAEQVAAGGELLVHCWRGGMRSSNFCQFVGMAKIKTHQLAGGYKAYRHHVLLTLGKPIQLRVLAGYTGSGKSELLRSLAANGEQVIDLEQLAAHKGSVFGGLMMPPQPSTEQFQNELFETIRALDPSKPVWVEDESITIGKVVLPEAFWKNMCASPIFEIDVRKDVRVQRLVREYGRADTKEFLAAMSGIERKLGGQNFQAAKEKLLAGDMASTIDILLTYYDKAYGVGLSKKQDRVKAKLSWSGSDATELATALIAHSR